MSEKDRKKEKKSNALDMPADDISIEGEPSEEISFKGDLSKLREKLKKCVEEKREYLDGWQRAKADLINYKKDEDKRAEAIRRFSNETLVKDILPVLEGFEEAKRSKSWHEAPELWRSGMENVLKELKKVLNTSGLEEIETGTEFDPNLHESVLMTKADKEDEDGEIEEVVQKGYLLNGRVLRAARVKVKIFKE